MKIFNWNFDLLNKNIDKSLEYIFNSDWDILMLQEVSESALIKLKEMFSSYEVYLELDYISNIGNTYLVCISKLPVVDVSRFNYHNRSYTSLFRKTPLNHVVEDLNTSIKLVVNENGTNITLFNIHLPWSIRPKWRIQMLDMFFDNVDVTNPVIVCGDFNIFGGSILFKSIFGILFNFHLDDYLVNEKKVFDMYVTQKNMFNPFRKINTQPQYPLNVQSDTILVSNHFKIENYEIGKVSYSDHIDLMLETRINI